MRDFRHAHIKLYEISCTYTQSQIFEVPGCKMVLREGVYKGIYLLIRWYNGVIQTRHPPPPHTSLLLMIKPPHKIYPFRAVSFHVENLESPSDYVMHWMKRMFHMKCENEAEMYSNQPEWNSAGYIVIVPFGFTVFGQ